MERLTKKCPDGNLETSLNLFYAKDGQAWVRGGGPEPAYLDITLYDFARQLILDYISDYPSDAIPTDDDKLGEMVTDWLMDPIATPERLIAWLYTAGWAFAELRGRLAAIEDILGDEYDLDRLREVVEAGRWIPTSERLPDAELEAWEDRHGTIEPFEVLVMIHGSQVPTVLIYDGGEFCDDTDLYSVDYWRPLPAPPKEAEEG